MCQSCHLPGVQRELHGGGAASAVSVLRSVGTVHQRAYMHKTKILLRDQLVNPRGRDYFNIFFAKKEMFDV